MSSAEAGRSTIVPIFVLGSARNGTTWLGNLLASHPEVASVHHRVHWGQHESAIYACDRYAGRLDDNDRLIRFLETYAACDFFRLAEGDKDHFYRQRPGTFLDFFLELMDRYAAKHGKRFWLTKLDPGFFQDPRALERFLKLLGRRYESVGWIRVQRDFPEVLRSYLGMEGRTSIHTLRGGARAFAALLHTARYVAHYSAIDRLLAGRRGVDVRYEALRRDPDATMDRVASELGLEPMSRWPSRYAANSSFSISRSRSQPSRWLLHAGDRVALPFFERVPGMARLVLRSREGVRGGRCPFRYRLLKLERMPEGFAEELRRTGQTALYHQIFGEGSAERTASGP